jgi:hypothetical protein
VRRDKAVPFKERQKFPEIRFDDFPGCAELAADFFRDLWFAVTLLQKFEHSRADQIEPKHPAVSDVQDNGAVLGVGGSDLFRQLAHGKAPVSETRSGVTGASVSKRRVGSYSLEKMFANCHYLVKVPSPFNAMA